MMRSLEVAKKRICNIGYLFCLVIVFFWLVGCATTSRTSTAVDKPAATSPQTDGNAAVFTADNRKAADLERLTHLWQKRTQEGVTSDYPIGPGDVLEVSVPAMEEFKDRTVRVSGEGTISLPFIGVMRAAGLSEKELREEVIRQLEKYMYGPQVNLFVREYRSRQVAVIGAVTKPGLYNLSSGADTILDMITSAGGMTEGAATRILFLPAEPIENEKVKEVISGLPVRLTSKDSSPLILKKTDPIVIDLQNLTYGGHQTSLTLPVRPGDVIMVPGGGQVLVEGWVEKPGSYKITPGLTVLGAVAAAGGPLFAANTSSVKVIRTGREGEKLSFLADLERIKLGEKPDIPIQEGDVIDVSASAPKLVPYGFYRFFSSVFNIGVGASVPIR
ncbi:MAG: polysaccharide export protein [Candidatus Tectomicrobia bacterium]|nr:polysaccharide export protein [Candidatus Tectomicrobia bacterium]